MALKDHLDILDSPDTITFLDRAQAAGFTLAQQQSLLGLLLLERQGKLKRTFDYDAPVAATEPGCGPGFARSFDHADWIDGESVVQAEQTSGEDGFNWRFHRIEDDLDALAADTAKAFACLSELRAKVAGALAELKAEINLIHSDIHACCNTTSGPVQTWPGTIYIPQQIPQYPQPIPQPIPQPYPWSPQEIMPKIWTYGPQPGTWNILYGSTPGQTQTIPGGPAGQPVDLVLAGMPATFVSRDTVLGREVDVWSTPAGMLLTDVGGGVGGTAFAGDRTRYKDPEIDRTATLARWLDGAKKKLATLGEGGFTRAQVMDAFGAEDLGGGRTVATLLQDVPAGVRFKDGAALLDATIANVTAGIAEKHRGALVIAASLGLGARVGEGAKAPIGALSSLPAPVRAALDAGGVDTVGELAKMPAGRVQQLLAGAHVAADSGDVASWQATAAMLAKVK